MESSFFIENRRALYARLEQGSLALVWSGTTLRKTADQYYPNFTDRNFMYLTGVDQSDAILLGRAGDNPDETLFIPPPDLMAERWHGTRIKDHEAAAVSGIKDIQFSAAFDIAFEKAFGSGEYHTLYLPLFKNKADEADGLEYRFARYVRGRFPHVIIRDLMPHIKALRLIKKPCEIAAMREARKDTGEGILAMMRASKPGMWEYQYKAEFDYALLTRGVLATSSQPIISAGKNNFSIHYHSYTGQALDGDMVLNDLGAVRENCMNDVSRAWPCNGRFSERQRLLYQCAYETCNYMFSIIKPGMPMGDVDATARRVNYEHLHDAGLCKSFDDAGTYIWHGGAHHVGFDVHDVVAITPSMPMKAGMVFSVDIGIYCEEWGIGFRLEDNCLITETGCENLTKDIPRSIEDIEAVMARR